MDTMSPAQPPPRAPERPHSSSICLCSTPTPARATRRRRTESLQPADKVFAVGFSFGWLCVHSVYKLSCTEARERARDDEWQGGGSRGVRERKEGRRD